MWCGVVWCGIFVLGRRRGGGGGGGRGRRRKGEEKELERGRGKGCISMKEGLGRKCILTMGEGGGFLLDDDDDDDVELSEMDGIKRDLFLFSRFCLLYRSV